MKKKVNYELTFTYCCLARGSSLDSSCLFFPPRPRLRQQPPTFLPFLFSHTSLPPILITPSCPDTAYAVNVSVLGAFPSQ